MSDNKAVILDYVNAFNRGDLDGVCRQFALDALVYGVLGFGGLDKARPIWEQLITCFKIVHNKWPEARWLWFLTVPGAVGALLVGLRWDYGSS